MYDELIKSLRYNAAFAYLGEGEDGKMLMQLMRDAADAIEELSRQHEAQRNNLVALLNERPRWIPVTERLPETPGEYMVAYHPCYWDRVHDEIKVGLDSFRGKTSWAKKKYQRVTHWMPLPESPKEGN